VDKLATPRQMREVLSGVDQALLQLLVGHHHFQLHYVALAATPQALLQLHVGHHHFQLHCAALAATPQVGLAYSSQDFACLHEGFVTLLTKGSLHLLVCARVVTIAASWRSLV